MRTLAVAAAAAWLLAVAGPVRADDEAAELAQKLANPISSLISLPFQYNWDEGFGPEDEHRHLLNVQPVIPLAIGDTGWNLISRTIVPFVHQEDLLPGLGSQTGIGDVVQSLFLSPQAPMGGFVWGAGPVLLFPTASDELLGADEWGAGPTLVVLRQDHGLTWGALANHVWSYRGSGDRGVDATFVQPFLSYTTRTATTLFLQSESTYDWKTERWSVPVNAGVNQLLKLGAQRIQVGLGGRWWAETRDVGPHWGLRANFVLLFPR